MEQEEADETASAGHDDEPGDVEQDEADDPSSAVSASGERVLDASARTDADEAVDRLRETDVPVLVDAGQASGSPSTSPAREVMPQPVNEARERVWERRRAPRVAVQLDGELHWRGGHWPVTVLDLSDSGLRLTLPRRPSVPGRQAPLADSEHVRVSFQAVSAVVEVSGQVAWQRPGPSGCEVGIFFGALPPDDLDLVLAVCAAHTDPAATTSG